MPRQIHIDNRLTDIVEMTGEGLQAPHEHFGFYEMPAMYMPPMPAYEPPLQPDWFETLTPPTPQPVMPSPMVEVQPEPEMVSYEPMTQELFEFFMQQAVEQAKVANEDHIDIRDTAEVNQILIDHGVEPTRNGLSVVLPEMLQEIDREISLVAQGFFEVPHRMSESPIQTMDPFGMGPTM